MSGGLKFTVPGRNGSADFADWRRLYFWGSLVGWGMKRSLVVVFALGVVGAFADQKGAEKVKVPVKAAIVGERDAANWEGEKIGNVEVVYKDGTKDRWTLKGNASNPRVSKEGVVGWVLSPLAKGGKELDLYKGLPTFPELRLVKAGKILATIEAERPYIEMWGFSKDGKYVVVKSRGPHGQAYVQRFTVAKGKLSGRVEAFGEDLPEWAKGYGE